MRQEILGLFDEPYVDKWSKASIIGKTTQYDNLRRAAATLIYADEKKTRTDHFFGRLISNSLFPGFGGKAELIEKTLFDTNNFSLPYIF